MPSRVVVDAQSSAIITNINADIININICIHSIAIRHFLYPHKPEGAAEVTVQKSSRFLRIGMSAGQGYINPQTQA